MRPVDQNVIQAMKLHYRKDLLKQIIAFRDISEELKKVHLKEVMIGIAKTLCEINIFEVKTYQKVLE